MTEGRLGEQIRLHHFLARYRLPFAQLCKTNQRLVLVRKNDVFHQPQFAVDHKGITDITEDWDKSMIHIRYIYKSEDEWLLKKAKDAKQTQQVKGKSKAPAKGVEGKELKPTFDPNEPCDIVY